MRNFVTWSYNTVRSLWDVVETKGQPEYLAYGMLVVAQVSGVGYYLRGFQNNLTRNWSAGGPQCSSNLVTFNMICRTYTNITGIDDKGRGEGLMMFITISMSGLLVYFSRITQDRGTGKISSVGSCGRNTAPLFLTATNSEQSIIVYDISSIWNVQNVTSEVPESRTRYCGGVTWPDDVPMIYTYACFFTDIRWRPTRSWLVRKL